MKKWILFMMCALLAATAAQGQISFYGEWCVKSSGKLEHKVWDNGKVMRIEAVGKDGKMFTNLIFGSDSLCILMPETKTYMVFTGEAMKGKTKKIAGVELETISNTVEKKLIEQETISGFLCNHYKVTKKDQSVDVNNGTTHEGFQIEDVWETPGIRHDIQHYGFDITMRILTNIKVGAQPANLFVIPKGYKRGGSLDDVMKSQHNMMKARIDKGHQAAKDLQDLQDGKKSSNKKANEMQEGFKALEELLKKKK